MALCSVTGPAGTSYQPPGVGYSTPNVEERQHQPSHPQPSTQQPSPQQGGGYNPLSSHRHREHDVSRYEGGRGERSALLPTPSVTLPSDAPVDHKKRLSYDDSNRGRKRKRPSRWESHEEERGERNIPPARGRIYRLNCYVSGACCIQPLSLARPPPLCCSAPSRPDAQVVTAATIAPWASGRGGGGG